MCRLFHSYFISWKNVTPIFFCFYCVLASNKFGISNILHPCLWLWVKSLSVSLVLMSVCLVCLAMSEPWSFTFSTPFPGSWKSLRLERKMWFYYQQHFACFFQYVLAVGPSYFLNSWLCFNIEETFLKPYNINRNTNWQLKMQALISLTRKSVRSKLAIILEKWSPAY